MAVVVQLPFVSLHSCLSCSHRQKNTVRSVFQLHWYVSVAAPSLFVCGAEGTGPLRNLRLSAFLLSLIHSLHSWHPYPIPCWSMLLVFTSFVQATSIYRAHYCTHCCFGHNMLFWLACHFLFPRCLQLMRNKEHCMSLDVFGLHLRVFWSAMMLGVSPSIRRRFAKLHGVERVQKHLLHLVGKAMLAKVHSCLTYLSNLRSCSDMFLWFAFCKSFQLHRCLRQRGFLSGWLRTVANKGTAVLNLQNRSKFAKTIIVTDVVPAYLYLVKGALLFVRDVQAYPGATGLCPIFRINCGLGKSDQIAAFVSDVIHRIHLYTLIWRWSLQQWLQYEENPWKNGECL